MQARFDVKTCARSLSRLMRMADACITKPGGGLHAQRVIDYVSNELGRMTMEQCLAVLAAIDDRYENKLLKDGNGDVIGYASSRKIFVTMRRDHHDNNRFEFANHTEQANPTKRTTPTKRVKATKRATPTKRANSTKQKSKTRG